MNNNLTQISNVLVIGSGGAGLRAAIEAKLLGMEVTVLGKRQSTDVHTVLAAGGINAAFGNVAVGMETDGERWANILASIEHRFWTQSWRTATWTCMGTCV